MKPITLITLFVLLASQIKAQDLGFGQIAFAKSSIEQIVKKFEQFPDTSKVYIKYYDLLNNQYIKCVQTYESYRGNIKSCLLANQGKVKKSKKCLEANKLEIQKALDSLEKITIYAYKEYYGNKMLELGISTDPGSINLDQFNLAAAAIKALIDGGISIAKYITDKNATERDRILKEMDSNIYNLPLFKDLISAPKTKGATKGKN